MSILAAVPALAQPTLLPLVAGNHWSLRSAGFSPVEMNVDYADVINGVSLAKWKLTGSWGAFSFLVSETAQGIYLDGLEWGGVEYRYPTSAPLFVAAPAGQSWSTPLGPITVTGAGLTVSTDWGTYNPCSRFRWDRSDGSVQQWTLCTNLGPVEFDAGGLVFSLTGLNLVAAAGAHPAVSGDCPALGVATIPRDSSLSLKSREAALQWSVQNTGRFLDIDATWSELEPSPGRFEFRRIQDELALAQKYGLQTAFTLKLVDNTVRGLPSDLAPLSWDDPVVTARLSTLLQKLVKVFPPQVKWLNLGYEVDGYFGSRRSQADAFGRLVASAKPVMRQQAPRVSIGIDFAFDSTRSSNDIFETLKPLCDHIALDYYAQGPGFFERDASSPSRDVPLMVRFAAGRPIILKEVGYSSATASGSSVDTQKLFFTSLVEALRKTSGQIVGASVWSIQDMPPDAVDVVLNLYGMGSDPVAASFLGSLGLVRTDSTTKPAWSTFTSATASFSVAGACMTPEWRH